MVERVALQMQRDQRVHPGRLDPAPAAVGFLAPEDPLGREAKRETAQPAQRPALVAMQRAVEPLEAAGPAAQRSPRRRGRPAAQLARREGQRADGAMRRDDRERHDRLTRPAAEVVHVERKPARQHDDLGRERRERVPRPEAEQRQPDPGEDARALDPAELAHDPGGALHVRGRDGVSGEPQGDVGLDRRRELRGAAEEGRPGSVGALLRADPIRGALRLALPANPEELAQQEILGVHRDVGRELALPEAALVLEREQPVARARQRLLGFGDAIGAAQRCAHAATCGRPRVRPAATSAARAAARPLRTAPSIVAGQPVSVQAPAR